VSNFLYGTSPSSPTDVWAVGQYFSNDRHTLIEHWDGTAWTIVPSPNAGKGDELRAVSALSSTDVWAVGDYDKGNPKLFTLIEHWDGTAWTIVPSPSPGYSRILYGVAAVSADDVWAVGFWAPTPYTPTLTLVEHWDGAVWTVATSPNPTIHGSFLLGVSASSSSDVWAVGYSFPQTVNQGLIEHWDGRAWTIVDSPNPPDASVTLLAVDAELSSNALAGGQLSTTSVDTLAERWNGSTWDIVATPNPGSGYNVFNGLSTSSTTNGWAVGSYYNGTSLYRSLTARWNGIAWKLAPSPNQGHGSNELYGVSSVSDREAWAVGYYLDLSLNQYQTLIEHFC
jgi:hypothetical protein